MRQRILSYFLHWRKNASKMSILIKEKNILSMNKLNSDYERNSLENEYKINIDLEVLKSIASRKNNKLLRKFLLRK